MRVLHLTPELPYAPGGSGGSTRQFQLLRRLRALGHDVTVVAPVHPSQREGADLLRGAGVDAARRAAPGVAGARGARGGARAAGPRAGACPRAAAGLAGRRVLDRAAPARAARRAGAPGRRARRARLGRGLGRRAARGPAARADPREPLVALLRGPRAGRGRRPGGRGAAARGAALRALRPPPPGRLRPARDDVRGRRRAPCGSVSDTPSVVVPNGVDTSALRAGPPVARAGRDLHGHAGLPAQRRGAAVAAARPVAAHPRGACPRRACSSWDATRRRRRAGWPASTTR